MEIGRLYFREEDGLRFLESVFRYLFNAADISILKTLKAIETASDKVKEIMMTTAERLKKEGFEKGISKGIEKGELQDKQGVLIRLADKKFGISDKNKQLIISVTDFVKLDNALDGIFSAETLEDLLEYLM